MKLFYGVALLSCALCVGSQQSNLKAAELCDGLPPLPEFGYKWDLTLPSHQFEHARWYITFFCKDFQCLSTLFTDVNCPPSLV